VFKATGYSVPARAASTGEAAFSPLLCAERGNWFRWRGIGTSSADRARELLLVYLRADRRTALLNRLIEAVVDRISIGTHPLSKQAKGYGQRCAACLATDDSYRPGWCIDLADSACCDST